MSIGIYLNIYTLSRFELYGRGQVDSHDIHDIQILQKLDLPQLMPLFISFSSVLAILIAQ